MTAPTPAAGPRWWESASGANSLVQVFYVLIGMVVLGGGWLARIEVHDQSTTDHFAAIEARHAEREAQRSEEKRVLEAIHTDLVDLRVRVVALGVKLDELESKQK